MKFFKKLFKHKQKNEPLNYDYLSQPITFNSIKKSVLTYRTNFTARYEDYEKNEDYIRKLAAHQLVDKLIEDNMVSFITTLSDNEPKVICLTATLDVVDNNIYKGGNIYEKICVN